MRMAVGTMIVAATLWQAPAQAQAPAGSPPNAIAGMQRFSGAVTAVKGNRVSVNAGNLGVVDMLVTPDTLMMMRRAATMADMHGNDFVGCTAVKQADG